MYYIKNVQVAAFSEFKKHVVPGKAAQVGKNYLKRIKNVTLGTSEYVNMIYGISPKTWIA